MYVEVYFSSLACYAHSIGSCLYIFLVFFVLVSSSWSWRFLMFLIFTECYRTLICCFGSSCIYFFFRQCFFGFKFGYLEDYRQLFILNLMSMKWYASATWKSLYQRSNHHLPTCVQRNFNLMTILWIKDSTLVLMVLDGSKMCTQNEIIGFSLFLMLLASC